MYYEEDIELSVYYQSLLNMNYLLWEIKLLNLRELERENKRAFKDWCYPVWDEDKTPMTVKKWAEIKNLE